MRISCVGGGPAGLCFAISMKQRDPGHEITVFERDPAGLTYGWGVTLWPDLLAKLHDTDPQSALQIRESCVRWENQVVHVQGKVAGRALATDVLPATPIPRDQGIPTCPLVA